VIYETQNQIIIVLDLSKKILIQILIINTDMNVWDLLYDVMLPL